MGWVELFVADDSDRPFYLTGPLVYPVNAKRLGRSGSVLAANRPLRPVELAARAAHAQKMREELDRPRPSPTALPKPR